ncbi:hypothetical protein [Gloeobacter kilaueensis]|uniref:Uncharacterized protein n=1 Tax=Gloeobacter kilaueensis (strain ATCC BAA-2537 / CCAP 1431/1 / ULC 316 / JS1) TaxID=1183438 RepID=U5QLX4_GLOK1|nr:hypothetical protein [Gloeobacter kilaueensis]AGY59911.1 hypothetical protein GKIL_3665 [Gloeobacter kilaueensis JS1]
MKLIQTTGYPVQQEEAVFARATIWSVGLGLLLSVAAEAKPIEIAFKDVRVEPCPEAQNTKEPVVSTNDRPNQPSKCYRLTGTAVNSDTADARDVDVFGRVTDANGTPALTRRRIGSIDLVPAGTHPVQLDFFVPESAKVPLTISITRAGGFSHDSRPHR